MLVMPLTRLTKQAGDCLQGDHSISFNHLADDNEIGDLARTLDQNRRAFGEVERQRWVKSGVAQLLATVEGAASLEEYGNALLRALAPMLHSPTALLYLIDGEDGQALREIGRYGLPATDTQPTEPPPLVVQASRQRQQRQGRAAPHPAAGGGGNVEPGGRTGPAARRVSRGSAVPDV